MPQAGGAGHDFKLNSVSCAGPGSQFREEKQKAKCRQELSVFFLVVKAREDTQIDIWG